jgi:RsiW-degrading membrane proteinase PrsW (M82 family)
MLNTILLYTWLTLLSFFPIVIWAYIFSYIDNDNINKKRFFIWIIWWALSVVPILYMDRLLEIINVKYLNIFYFISNISDFFSSIEFWFSLALFFLVIITISFLLWAFIHFFKKIFSVYVQNIVIFLIFIVFISFLVFLLNIPLTWIDFEVSGWIKFWDIIFNSFKLIIFYYLLVAFIEETSKHFNFLQSSILHIDSIKTWVLYAVFVALWFSLVENVLYLYNIYIINWWISWELLKTYFFRSIFSVIVHVLCSSVVAYYFSKALLLYREKNFSIPYLKIFSFWLLISIILHLIFDVALTLGFWFIMFIYFIWGYLYVSSIFYKE